ncbi:MAG: DUF1566 domain-containing protein [Campylobacterota bacterium]
MRINIFLITLLLSAGIMFSACSDDSDSNVGDRNGSTSAIKKTGQILSYDIFGVEVTDGSLRDDGYYQKGVDTNYTRASDIVTDELTGLMWQDNPEGANLEKPWLSSDNFNSCDINNSSPACYDTSGDTAATYCAELTLGHTRAGYTDWRLPTIEELSNIVALHHLPAIDTIFQSAPFTDTYWSSNTAEFSKDSAYVVDFYKGNTAYGGKSLILGVICVRDGG